MHSPRTMSRRRLLGMLSGLATSVAGAPGTASPAGELALPAHAPTERWSFDTGGLDRWTVVDGQWSIEPLPDAPSGRRVLVQRAVKNAFDVIVVAPSGPYTDVDVPVKLKPMSGREDASGGIVFR